MAHRTSHFAPQARHINGQPSPVSVRPIDVRSASDDDIAKRAYEKYEARGRTHGLDLEDWTAASHELIAETFGHLSLARTPTPSLSPNRHAS